MTALIKWLQDNAKTSISLGSIAGLLFFGTLALDYFDTRYLLASEARVMQQIQVGELEDKILVMDLKKQGLTQEQIEETLRERWEQRIKDLKDQVKD